MSLNWMTMRCCFDISFYVVYEEQVICKVLISNDGNIIMTFSLFLSSIELSTDEEVEIRKRFIRVEKRVKTAETKLDCLCRVA